MTGLVRLGGTLGVGVFHWHEGRVKVDRRLEERGARFLHRSPVILVSFLIHFRDPKADI